MGLLTIDCSLNKWTALCQFITPTQTDASVILFMDLFKPFRGIFSTSKAEVVVGKERKGHVSSIIYNGYFRPQTGEKPDTDLNLILKLYNEDSDVKACINAKLNAITSADWRVEGNKEDSQSLSLFRAMLKRSRWTKLQRQLLLNSILYNNFFVEIEMKNGKAWKCYLLDAETMEIKHDEYGNVQGYIQRPKDGSAMINFKEDEVWHFSIEGASSQLWGEIDMKALFRTINTKNFIEKFINWLSSTNQWRNIIKVKNVSDDDLRQFMADYMASQDDPNIPLMMNGEFEQDVLRTFQEAKDLIEVLTYMRHKICMHFQVPPIVVGVVDNSNRSNSEMEYKIFQMNNEALRKLYAEEFNNEFVPLCGYRDIEFCWSPIDKRSEKDAVEIALNFSKMGMKNDAIETFLRKSGFEFSEEGIFDEPTSAELIEADTESDMDTSKAFSDKEMTQKKTGSESTTREEQLVGKDKRFGSFPYTF